MRGNVEDILKSTLLNRDGIHEICVQLGKQLAEGYAGKEPALVGILTGTIFFMTNLAREMDVRREVGFISVSGYGNGLGSPGRVKSAKDVHTDLTNRDVLIVENIAGTGHTMKLMKQRFPSLETRSAKCVALLDRLSRRVDGVVVDYYGSKADNQYMVGYGLGFYNVFRNIPYIGIIKPEVIQAYTNK